MLNNFIQRWCPYQKLDIVRHWLDVSCKWKCFIQTFIPSVPSSPQPGLNSYLSRLEDPIFASSIVSKLDLRSAPFLSFSLYVCVPNSEQTEKRPISSKGPRDRGRRRRQSLTNEARSLELATMLDTVLFSRLVVLLFRRRVLAEALTI